MKKRILSLLTLVCLLIGVIPLGVSASAASISDLTYTITDGEVTITNCLESASGELIIPAEIEGYPVTTIGFEAFKGCADLTSVIIPEGVTSIAFYAFYHCYNLKSIVIPESVKYINNWAFQGCDALESVKIPNGVTYIGEGVFCGCDSLKNITIPKNVTNIDGDAFFGCGGLESITVAKGNTKYHSDGNCIIETANNRMILGCKNSVIPDYVTEIGVYSFTYCDGLTSVNIPEGVTTIEGCAFYGCEDLSSIVLPKSLTELESGAFENCTGIASIVVAEGNAVYHSEGNCVIETELNRLNIGCKNSIIPDYVTIIRASAFENCHFTDIVIPESVTTINEYAFAWTDLASIVIPESVTTARFYLFYKCYDLRVIYCETESQPEGWHYGWLDGCDATVYWGCTSESVQPLVEALKEIEGLSEESYDAESWSRLQTVLEEVVGFDPSNKTTTEIDAMAAKLNNVVSSLVELVKNRRVGDVNNDGEVDKNDYIALKRYCFETVQLDEESIRAADINNDGEINKSDYNALKRACFGTYKISPEYLS